MKPSLALALVACAGCSSARIAGGGTVAPGGEPAGVTLSAFNMGRCEDEHGARIPESEARITLVRTSDGRVVLVDRRPGYDSVVVDNGWEDGDARVFQLALKRSDGVPYVREYRLPRDGAELGRLAVVERVAAWHDSRRGFRATYTEAALSCALARF